MNRAELKEAGILLDVADNIVAALALLDGGTAPTIIVGNLKVTGDNRSAPVEIVTSLRMGLQADLANICGRLKDLGMSGVAVDG